MSDNTVIQKMISADLSAVHAIESASFITPWSYNSLKADLKNKLAYYCVAKTEGTVSGYAGMWLVFDEAHITNIAVDTQYRRKHIGCSLMRHMIDTAIERGAKAMTLEVRRSNTAAQNLYAGLGFAQAGIRKGYYSDTGEDALILWKYLI